MEYKITTRNRRNELRMAQFSQWPKGLPHLPAFELGPRFGPLFTTSVQNFVKMCGKKTTEIAISFSNFNIKKHQRYTEATDTDKASIVDETFFGTASQFLSGTAKSLNS